MPRRILFTTAAAPTSSNIRFRRVVRTTQPQSTVGLNTARRQGATLLWSATNPLRDAARNVAGTVGPAEMARTYVSGLVGQRGGSIGSERVDFVPPPEATSTNYTVFAYVTDDAGSGTNRNPFDSDNATRVFQLRFGVTDGVEFIAFDTSSNPYFATGGGMSWAPRTGLLVGRITNNQLSVWWQGKQMATGTLSGTARTLSAGNKISIGGSSSNNQGFPGQVHLAGHFNIALSDAEIISLSSNPWQLFDSQTIRFNTEAVSVLPTTYLPRRRKVNRIVQPQISTVINKSNKLTNGLTALVNGGYGLKGDLVTNTPAWEYPGSSIATTSGISIGNAGPSTNGVYWDRRSNSATTGPANLSPTNPIFSAAVAFHHFAHESGKSLFGNGFGTGSGWAMYSHFTDGTVIAYTKDSGGLHAISSPSGTLKIGQLNTAIITCDGANLHLYVNGVLATAPVAVAGTSLEYDASFAQLILGGALNPFGNLGSPGVYHYGAIWNRALTASEIAELHNNPWQLFDPINRYYNVPVTISSTTVPNSDIVTAGWLTTEGTYYGALNETTYNDATYITSPTVVGASVYEIIMGLSASLATGSYDVAIRLKSNGTTKLRVSLLDTSNTVLGTSSWQNATGTYAAYTLPVTVTGTATRIKIEVANI